MFIFRNLDSRTRGHMLSELDRDMAGDGVFESRRFTSLGRAAYADLLRAAVTDGSEQTLASALSRPGYFATEELRRGKPVTVPFTAPLTFAEGEFNRYYARGTCLRALEDGHNNVVIYRAKEVDDPRPTSEALIGTQVAATTLLDDLRTNAGQSPTLRLPGGPNSGLSVYCGCVGCCDDKA